MHETEDLKTVIKDENVNVIGLVPDQWPDCTTSATQQKKNTFFFAQKMEVSLRAFLSGCFLEETGRNEVISFHVKKISEMLTSRAIVGFVGFALGRLRLLAEDPKTELPSIQVVFSSSVRA